MKITARDAPNGQALTVPAVAAGGLNGTHCAARPAQARLAWSRMPSHPGPSSALDIREITHQLNESRPALAAPTAAVAALHLVAGAAALTTTRLARARPGGAP